MISSKKILFCGCALICLALVTPNGRAEAIETAEPSSQPASSALAVTAKSTAINSVSAIIWKPDAASYDASYNSYIQSILRKIQKDLQKRYKATHFVHWPFPKLTQIESPFTAAATSEEDALKWFGLQYPSVLEAVSSQAERFTIVTPKTNKGLPMLGNPVAPAELQRSLALLSYGVSGESIIRLACYLEEESNPLAQLTNLETTSIKLPITAPPLDLKLLAPRPEPGFDSHDEVVVPTDEEREVNFTRQRTRHLADLLGLINEGSLREGVLWQDAALWGQRYSLVTRAFREATRQAFGAQWYLGSFLTDRGRSNLQKSLAEWERSQGLDDSIAQSIPPVPQLRLMGMTSTRLQAKWESDIDLEEILGVPVGFKDFTSRIKVLRGAGLVQEFQNDLIDAVSVPVEEGLSLLIVMSRAGVEELRESLVETPFGDILEKMQPADREFVIPQISAKGDVSSVAGPSQGSIDIDEPQDIVLGNLMIKGQADFRAVNNRRNLFLRSLRHQVSLRIDGEGIFGQASTQFLLETPKREARSPGSGGVIIQVIGGNHQIEAEVRPFAYAVVVDLTRTVLFCGEALPKHLLPE